MKTRFVSALFAGLILAPCLVVAQAPAGAPAGTTGKCKDGTYTSTATRQGACRGHKGIDTWYAADTGSKASSKSAAAAPASTPAATTSPAPSPKQTSAPAPASTSKASTARAPKTAAPGGGPGLVWVNSSTNVYHCYGSQFYGTTKSGKYMSEADAKAAGARPDRNKACSVK
jgi:uncharacterized protein DUF3761